MSDWKYVMFQDTDGRCTPILFPGTLIHKDVADAFGLTVVSAGIISALHVSGTEGESTTLHIKANRFDADIINHYPYSNGMPDTLPDMKELMRQAYLRILNNG